MLSGGSIEKLKEMLGHYSVVVTERYAHLRPDLFPVADLSLIALNMQAGCVTRLEAADNPASTAARTAGRGKNGAIGHSSATAAEGLAAIP